MDPQADPAVLYEKANRLLAKWRYHWDRAVLEDAKQEMVLGALEGKQMKSVLSNFMAKQTQYHKVFKSHGDIERVGGRPWVG